MMIKNSGAVDTRRSYLEALIRRLGQDSYFALRHGSDARGITERLRAAQRELEALDAPR